MLAPLVVEIEIECRLSRFDAARAVAHPGPDLPAQPGTVQLQPVQRKRHPGLIQPGRQPLFDLVRHQQPRGRLERAIHQARMQDKLLMAAGQRLRQRDPREHLLAIDPQRLHRAVRRAVVNLDAIEQPVQGIGLKHMAADRRLQRGQRFRRFAWRLGPNRFPLAAHRLRLALENAECQPMFIQAVDADFHFDRLAALRFDGHGLRPHQVAQGQDAGRGRFAQRAADRLPRHFKVSDARQDLVAMDPVIPQEELVPVEYRDEFLLRQIRDVGMQ